MVDFGKTAQDYRQHRAGFPPELLDRLSAFGVGGPGQRLLDVGTGTGTLARQFAERGALVTGIDPAAPMLAQARALDAAAGVSVTYLEGKAEVIPLPDGSFDAITAGQCWHWFDRPKAAGEMHRLLGPGGRMVIAHFDWLPLPGSLVAATEALILRFNPAWALGGGRGIYPIGSKISPAPGLPALKAFPSISPFPTPPPPGWAASAPAPALPPACRRKKSPAFPTR
ncbi:class I SAM-dependent methyltransferase [Elstera litoralis]|uniref:class I SAM-dependent methyltransferase n=1 Tax=Elstera litoralis TaxID=552518 RepID=UPI000ABAFE97|nr:methyltransferase domain-containing protein [Elstera litoralis]